MENDSKLIMPSGKPLREMSQDEIKAITFRKRCTFCGGPPNIRIRALIQLSELLTREPEFAAAIMATNPEGPVIPTVATTYGQMVRVRDYCACSACQVDAEVQAAHYPSYYIVEINRAPAEKEVWSQVPTGGLII